jgi:hypothetical protein
MRRNKNIKCVEKEEEYIIAENLLLDKTCSNCMFGLTITANKNYSCRNHMEFWGLVQPKDLMINPSSTVYYLKPTYTNKDDECK